MIFWISGRDICGRHLFFRKQREVTNEGNIKTEDNIIRGKKSPFRDHLAIDVQLVYSQNKFEISIRIEP